MSKKNEKDIADWRRHIDAIDDELLGLLNRRANCSIEIGWIKRSRNMDIYVPQRETQILRRMTRANRGPLSHEAVRRLFERIIDESRSTERTVCSEGEVRYSGRRRTRKNANRTGKRRE
ncbi:MAG: chorismate mutase [Acidobacteriota bacterium]